MKTNKQLLLGAAAAAVLAVFNPALAGGGKSAGVNADTDVKAGVNADAQTQGKSQSNAAADTGASANMGAGAGASGDVDKSKGLDRADQAAGEHGKHGRDNARDKQSRNDQRQGGTKY